MTTQNRSSLVRLKDTADTIAAREDDIRGRHVSDKSGDDIGKIEAILIDKDNEKIRFIEVATGGFLGIGKGLSLVPIDAITAIDAGAVHLDQTSEVIAGSPPYDPELAQKNDFLYGSTYGYYGLLPYWGMGYAYPIWPARFTDDSSRR